MNIIKVYGLNPIKVHTSQGWIPFKEYRRCDEEADGYEYFYWTIYEDGSECQQCGTEDFSVERAKNLQRKVYNKVKDSGEKYPSGKTKWDNLGIYSFSVMKNDEKATVKLLKNVFKRHGIILI